LAQQNLEGHKKFRGDYPRMTPVATGLIPIFRIPHQTDIIWRNKVVRSNKLSLTVVSYPDLFAGNHVLTAHAKTCVRMLRRRAVDGDNCGVVSILRTTWCSQKAAHPKEEYREFALINQRRNSNLGFQTLAKLQNSSVDF